MPHTHDFQILLLEPPLALRAVPLALQNLSRGIKCGCGKKVFAGSRGHD
jgi:hypothetical protein